MPQFSKCVWDTQSVVSGTGVGGDKGPFIASGGDKVYACLKGTPSTMDGSHTLSHIPDTQEGGLRSTEGRDRQILNLQKKIELAAKQIGNQNELLEEQSKDEIIFVLQAKLAKMQLVSQLLHIAWSFPAPPRTRRLLIGIYSSCTRTFRKARW